MIAVVANQSDHDAVQEFFELFKTPWRFYEDGCGHDVLLCAQGELPASSARLVVLCGSNLGPETARTRGGQRVIHFESDLFAKVRQLLTTGQPADRATTPTLDHYIERLRALIVENGIDLVEIPPVPPGFKFIACLTHDVDHARVRYHKWDPAIAGFLYRATFGSLVDLCTGRKRLKHLAANWMSAVSLPLVYTGAAADFWDQFEDFIDLEGAAPSTFFFVSRSGDPGLDASGNKPWKRAVKYELNDVAKDITQLHSARKEIAVHGIEAWRDASKGREEREALQEVASSEEVGVRMHWLFFDESSPAKLEEAGFSYDSTFGYNGTIGFRAGTAQVFKPLQCEHLLELPLHIMDTALFFPSHLHLSAARAEAAIAPLLEHAARSGGVLTVNWHDRSLGPERLWNEPYVSLIESLRAKTAWFATARDAVRWFRKRRKAKFEKVAEDGAVRVRVAHGFGDDLPPLQLRTHRSSSADSRLPEFSDFALHASETFRAAA